MTDFTGEQIDRFEQVISEAVAFYPNLKADSMFRDVLGAIVYLHVQVLNDNQRIKEQARTIMNLHEQILKDDTEYDPLGMGAIIEPVDRYPLPGGNYMPGGSVGVVRYHYKVWSEPGDNGEYVGVRFPGMYETFKISTAIVRIVRRPQHAR